MIKLVAFDMDGTILDEESRISQESLRTIERLLERGIAVASNSGRSITLPVQQMMHTKSKVACGNSRAPSSICVQIGGATEHCPLVL